MRRFALAVVLAALVASAALASGAAASPAFFECAKVAHGVPGEFKDKACTEGEQHGTGKYELVEGVGKKNKFGLNKSVVELEFVSAEEQFTCKKGELAGVISSPATVSGAITLKTCTTVGSTRQCTSAGQARGVLVIGPLSGSLGYVDSEAKEVGLDLAGEKAGPIAEFTCEGEAKTYQLDGSLIGLMGEDVNVASKNMSFVGGYERLEGGLPDVLSLVTLPEESEQPVRVRRLHFSGKSGAELEIKA